MATLDQQLTHAEAHLAAGRPAEAAALLREALDQADPRRYPEVAAALGAALRSDGRLGEAELWLRTAARSAARVLGEADPAAAFARVRLADLLCARGRLDEAAKLAREAAAKLDATEPGSPAALRALVVGARIASERGELPLAEALLERVLASGDEEARVDALGDWVQLALVLGKTTAAERAAEEVVAFHGPRGVAGEGRLASALDNLGCVRLARGQYADGAEALRRSLELHERAHGARHPGVVRVLNNLAVALAELGRPVEADALLSRALPLAREIHGEESASYASTLLVSAQLDAALARPSAKARGRSALALFERCVGAEHWRTREARRALADVFDDLAVSTADEPAVVLVKIVRKSERALAAGEPARALQILEGLFGALPPEGMELVELSALPTQVRALAHLERWAEAHARVDRGDALRARLGATDDPAWTQLAGEVRLAVARARASDLQARIQGAVDAALAGRREGVEALKELSVACAQEGHLLLAAAALVHLGKLHRAAERPEARGYFDSALAILEQEGHGEAAQTIRESLAAEA